MNATLACRLRRMSPALVWLPILLIEPALSLPADGTGWAAAVLVMIAAAVVAAGLSVPLSRGSSLLSSASLLALAALTVAGSFAYGAHWLTLWLLLAIMSGAVLRGAAAAMAVVAVPVAGALTVWRMGEGWNEVWTHALTVLLAGFATAAFVRLIETVDELRRTREDLAVRAVSEERERFSRDLHDLLGHTLSVIVVKAEAVRRLAERDPAGAVEHARDIEAIGRQALTEVRSAVDGYRDSTLDAEVTQAQRTLEAASIDTAVVRSPHPLPAVVDEAFTWVVREGVTNILQHSAARHCRLEIGSVGGSAHLALTDDGTGTDPYTNGRRGGLDGLRQRVEQVRGELHAAPAESGFSLTVLIPTSREATTR